jgi:integrase
MQGRSGRIIDVNPSVISDRFRDYIRTLNLENVFRFHDLRHYSASIMHAIGIPDVYIMQRGGWATDHVMKTVYRNAIDEEAKKNTSKILHHFSNLPAMQHEMQHEQD